MPATPSVPARRASFAGRALVAVALAAAVALAVEQTYRVFVFGGAAWSYARMNSVHDLWVSGLIRAAANPEIVFELKPSLDTYFKLAPLATNAQGLRDVERAQRKAPGVVRAAMVGSSFSMPAGVALEDAWHQVAARMLDARRPGVRHEVVNFAVGGYNVRQNLAVLAERALAYEPDLVLFELTTHLPYMTQPDAFHRRAFAAAPRTYPFWQSFVIERVRTQFATPAADPSPYPAQMLAAIEQSIGRAAEIARGRGVPICFVVLNVDQRMRRNAELLAQAAARHAPCVVDTTPAFAGADLADFAIYRIDQHPNARANRVFAEAVVPVIARAFPGGAS